MHCLMHCGSRWVLKRPIAGSSPRCEHSSPARHNENARDGELRFKNVTLLAAVNGDICAWGPPCGEPAVRLRDQDNVEGGCSCREPLRVCDRSLVSQAGANASAVTKTRLCRRLGWRPRNALGVC